MANEQQEVTKQETITGKTVWYGGGGLSHPTPQWALIMFRVVYWLAFGFSLWVSSTNLIVDNHKVELMLAATVIDKVFWGIAKGFGVKKNDFGDDESPTTR